MNSQYFIHLIMYPVMMPFCNIIGICCHETINDEFVELVACGRSVGAVPGTRVKIVKESKIVETVIDANCT